MPGMLAPEYEFCGLDYDPATIRFVAYSYPKIAIGVRFESGRRSPLFDIVSWNPVPDPSHSLYFRIRSLLGPLSPERRSRNNRAWADRVNLWRRFRSRGVSATTVMLDVDAPTLIEYPGPELEWMDGSVYCECG